MVGAFWIVSAKTLLALNAFQQAEIGKSSRHLERFTPHAGLRRSLIRVITWLAFPFVVFVLFFTTTPYSGVAIVALLIALSQLITAAGTFSFNSTSARSMPWAFLPLAYIAWCGAAALIILAFVSLANFTDPTQTVFAIVVVLTMTGVCAAWLPIPVLERKWAPWVPSHAAKASSKHYITLRMTKLKIEAEKLEKEATSIAKSELAQAPDLSDTPDSTSGVRQRSSSITIRVSRAQRSSKR